MVKFLRTDIRRHLKLGKRRKKYRKWRRPRGRHNKIREKRVGYPVMPTVGYKTAKKDSGKIQGLAPMLVNNLRDLSKLDKGNLVILSSKLGARKKLEVIKKAEEMNLKILNLGGKK